MCSKSIKIIVGVLTCASLQVCAGLFDKVSDLTGGIIKIEENNSDDAQTAPHEAVSREAKKYSDKMSRKEYIAERDAFIERVKENWGTSASAFNIENKDFAQIRELYPEEAGSLAERAAGLRGSVFSNLKYTSDKKEGLKLLKKLYSDETELRTIFDGLKVKTTHRQAEMAKVEIEELKSLLSAERKRCEASERKVRELESGLSAEREARIKAENMASELTSRLNDERFGNELRERQIKTLKDEVARKSECEAAQKSPGTDTSGTKMSAVSSAKTTDERDRAVISEMIEDRLVQRLILSGKAGRTECDMLKSQLLDKLMTCPHEGRVDTANLLINEVIRTFGL